MTFNPGDRVGVKDPGLEQLRTIMARYGDAPPNNEGTVDSIEDGFVYINFDEDGVEAAGNCAPYPVEDVYLLACQYGDEGPT